MGFGALFITICVIAVYVFMVHPPAWAYKRYGQGAAELYTDKLFLLALVSFGPRFYQEYTS